MPTGSAIFDESVMFREPGSGVTLKEDFRNRFRNVSRIMDCVGCDKCRLWGKVQTAGYGTALKVLFEFDENDSSQDPPLRRTELVALLNTMDRLSHSLSAIKQFRRMIDERDGVKTVEAWPTEEAEAIKAKLSLDVDAEKDDTVDDDGFPNFSRSHRAGMTIMEEFWEECDLVSRAFIYVIKSWIALPGKA
jgi:hypothetical protein